VEDKGGGSIVQIGIAELIVVFLVALFAVGPDRLPGYAKKLGEAVSQFKRYSEEATREIKESVVEPLEEVQAPLREAAKPLEELDRTVRGDVKEIKESFAGIGKQKKPAAPPPETENAGTEDIKTEDTETQSAAGTADDSSI